MSLSDDVKAVLEGDTTLMALLVGGVHNDVAEISRQNAPTAFDENGEILPCALIKLGVETKRGPFMDSVQVPVVIYFYQWSGSDVVEPATVRVYGLLGDKKVGSNVWRIEYEMTAHDMSMYDQEKQALDVSMSMMRFVGVVNRKGDVL